MKKTLLALAVVAAAGSVNAATVYDKDGFTADVFGDLEVTYRQGVTEDKAYFKPADYDFGFKASTAVNDDITIFGEASFNGNETQDDSAAGSNAVIVDNAFIGMKTGDLTVTAGRVINFVDEIGVANDQQIAGEYEAKAGLDDKTSQVMKVVYDNGQFYAGLAVSADEDGDKTTNDKAQTGVMAGVKMSGADVRVTYEDGETDGAVDQEMLAVEAHYSIEGWDLGALYTDAELGNADSSAISLSAQYTMDKTTVGAGWSTMDADGAEDKSQWYANVSYAVAKNASVYAEIMDTDVDGEDTGYAVGAKLKF